MSIEMDQAAGAILQAARLDAMSNELSDVEVDGDGSSSLSDIEDKDVDQREELEDEEDNSDELSNISDEENDSEAETERLEESPNKFRPHQDVVLSSTIDHIYDRSPGKLQNQVMVVGPEDEEDRDDDEPLSDEEISNESLNSPKSSAQDEIEQSTKASKILKVSSTENKKLLSIDADTRKRKRSIMGISGLDDDLTEPLRKRSGSIMAASDGYPLDADIIQDEEADISNPVSGSLSGDEGGVVQEDDSLEDVEESVAVVGSLSDEPIITTLPKRRGRKKKSSDIETSIQEENLDSGVSGEVKIGDDDAPENEPEDEVEAALRNEEELEKKRIALDQLSEIERHFSTFRERLYEERLEQLNREEVMLRQAHPTHPEYLAMMQCVNDRRNEKLRIADQLREYQYQTLKRVAVAQRSQVLVQFQQEVRDIREKKLEKIGEQWHKIQHDRRIYAGNVPDFAIKFPTKKSQQVSNHIAYSNEVSILSGIAKHVGFPAAPNITPATTAELEEDMEKMGRTRLAPQSSALPLHELVAIRAASSTSRFKPAEERFIEQTPWANPQHPSHAHMLQHQRQSLSQQSTRTTSPFSQVQVQPRRKSHQHGGGPIPGTFSDTPPSFIQHLNGNGIGTGRVSPHNPFGNSTHSHTVAPAPGHLSISPELNRVRPTVPDQSHHLPNNQNIHRTSGTPISPLGVGIDYVRESRLPA